MKSILMIAAAGAFACAASVASASTILPSGASMETFGSWVNLFDFELPVIIPTSEMPVDVSDIVDPLITAGPVAVAVAIDPVPLPASASLMLLGLGALVLRKRLR